MSRYDWEEGFQGVFDSIPGTGYLEDWEVDHVEALFDAGFTHTAAEYEAMGLSQDQVQAIRDELFDYMGIDQADFDWEGWREAMGYD
jgi:hypothetical protein